MGISIFALVSVLVVLLLIDHTRPTTLPAPTGPFPVGRITLVMSDPAQPALLAPQPGTRRELFAWMWYPAAAENGSGKPAEYMSAAWRAAAEEQAGVLLTDLLTRDLAAVRTHSTDSPPLSPAQRSYPVVLMRAGLAAPTVSYTTLAEDLASHGYVVVGVDAPYRTRLVVFPDGRVIYRAPQNDADLVSDAAQVELAGKLVQAWSADMSFVLDQLQILNTSDPQGRFIGRLDMNRVGIFGHSLGGATALQFCHDDPRCKACVDIDGAPLGSVVTQGVPRPTLFLLDDGQSDTMDARANQAVLHDIRSIYSRLPDEDRLLVTIKNSNHFMFSDDSALLKSHVIIRLLRLCGLVRIDGARQLAETSHYLSTFFDAHLKAPRDSETSRPARGF